MSPSPLAGSSPKRNTIGKTTRPATSATSVSMKTMVLALRPIDSPRGRYAAYAIMPAMPTPMEKKAWPTAASTVEPVTMPKSGAKRYAIASGMPPANTL